MSIELVDFENDDIEEKEKEKDDIEELLSAELPALEKKRKRNVDPAKKREVTVRTCKDFIDFVHEKCGENMQIRLRKPQELSSGRWKQHLEIKCWVCGEHFKPWKKNVYKKKKMINEK